MVVFSFFSTKIGGIFTFAMPLKLGNSRIKVNESNAALALSVYIVNSKYCH